MTDKFKHSLYPHPVPVPADEAPYDTVGLFLTVDGHWVEGFIYDGDAKDFGYIAYLPLPEIPEWAYPLMGDPQYAELLEPERPTDRIDPQGRVVYPDLTEAEAVEKGFLLGMLVNGKPEHYGSMVSSGSKGGSAHAEQLDDDPILRPTRSQREVDFPQRCAGVP